MGYLLHIFIVGMAIFSMFFGGGNLTYPLWIGSETASVSLSSFGFFLSGVLLPLYGIVISIYFKGNYESYLNSCGKAFGAVLVFALLSFWIPFGSGPRCNHLAFGAFSTQFAWDIPFWVYSLIYSIVVYVLTYRENRVIEILGKVITPLLILSLAFLIYVGFAAPELNSVATINPSNSHSFLASFFAGYHTMDFIAAIFFSSTVISLIKEKQKEKFNMSLVSNACLFALVLLSLIYIGLINLGHASAESLINVPRDRLLAVIGQQLVGAQFQFIIFVVITLSVLSTSIALSLVFSDYLRKTLFRNKLSHPICLLLSVGISFFMSIIGFENLSVIISHATNILYPVLLLVTTLAFFKSLYGSQRSNAAPSPMQSNAPVVE